MPCGVGGWGGRMVGESGGGGGRCPILPNGCPILETSVAVFKMDIKVKKLKISPYLN